MEIHERERTANDDFFAAAMIGGGSVIVIGLIAIAGAIIAWNC